MFRQAIDRMLDFQRLDSGTGRPHIHRWRIWNLGPWGTCYLHHIVGSDRARHLHDHPKPFLSIGLSGGYLEELPGPVYRTWLAPWIRRFPATHIHRLHVNQEGGAWTLVFTGRRTREWGFWTRLPSGRMMDGARQWMGGRWIPWKRYIRDGAR